MEEIMNTVATKEELTEDTSDWYDDPMWEFFVKATHGYGQATDADEQKKYIEECTSKIIEVFETDTDQKATEDDMHDARIVCEEIIPALARTVERLSERSKKVMGEWISYCGED